MDFDDINYDPLKVIKNIDLIKQWLVMNRISTFDFQFVGVSALKNANIMTKYDNFETCLADHLNKSI